MIVASEEFIGGCAEAMISEHHLTGQIGVLNLSQQSKIGRLFLPKEITRTKGERYEAICQEIARGG